MSRASRRQRAKEMAAEAARQQETRKQVEALYRDILKREGGAGGLDYWTKHFMADGKVDASERAAFLRGAAPEMEKRGLSVPGSPIKSQLASGSTEPEPKTTPTPQAPSYKRPGSFEDQVREFGKSLGINSSMIEKTIIPRATAAKNSGKKHSWTTGQYGQQMEEYFSAREKGTSQEQAAQQANTALPNATTPVSNTSANPANPNRLSREELEQQHAAKSAAQKVTQSRGREANELVSQAQNMKTTLSQSQGKGGFGRDGFHVGAENVAVAKAAGLIGDQTSHVNRIDINDPAKAQQIEEVRGIASKLGLTEEQTNKALNASRSRQTGGELMASMASGGNAQDFVNRQQRQEMAQQTALQRELGTEGAIVSNLAALNPDVYETVDLNNPVHVDNLGHSLKMLQNTSSHGQNVALNHEPSNSWADVVGGQILPKVVGGVITAATAGASSPLLAGMGVGGAYNALQGVAAGEGSLGEILQNAAVGAGQSAVGTLARGIGTGLESGIGGVPGTIAGDIGEGLVKTVGNAGISALQGEDVSLSGTLKDAAINVGTNVAGSAGGAVLNEAKGALGMETTPAVSPVPVDAAGEELGFMDRVGEGFKQAGENIMNSIGIGDMSTGDTLKESGTTTSAEPGDIAPSALEVEAAPGDIGLAQEGATIPTTKTDLARLANTDTGYGIGAGIQDFTMDEGQLIQGGDYNFTHEQENLAQAPTGPMGVVQEPIENINIPDVETVTGGVEPLPLPTIEELGGPYLTTPDPVPEYSPTAIQAPIMGEPVPNAIQNVTGTAPSGLSTNVDQALTPPSIEELGGPYLAETPAEDREYRDYPESAPFDQPAYRTDPIENVTGIDSSGLPTVIDNALQPTNLSIEDLSGPYLGGTTPEDREYRPDPIGSPFEELIKEQDVSPEETLAQVATGISTVDENGQPNRIPGVRDPIVTSGIAPPPLTLEDLEEKTNTGGGLEMPPPDGPPTYEVFTPGGALEVITNKIEDQGGIPPITIPPGDDDTGAGATSPPTSPQADLFSSSAGQEDPMSDLQRMATGTRAINSGILSNLIEAGLTDEEKKKRKQLWMANPVIEGV